MAPMEALYGRTCRSPIRWFDSVSIDALDTDLLRDAIERVRLIQSQLLEFMVGNLVWLKISAMKRVMRFEKTGKLSPRFIGLFEILRRVGEIAYELALPPRLSVVHPVFHVSMLRKYIPDESHVIFYDGVELDPNLTYEEEQ